MLAPRGADSGHQRQAAVPGCYSRLFRVYVAERSLKVRVSWRLEAFGRPDRKCSELLVACHAAIHPTVEAWHELLKIPMRFSAIGEPAIGSCTAHPRELQLAKI